MHVSFECWRREKRSDDCSSALINPLLDLDGDEITGAAAPPYSSANLPPEADFAPGDISCGECELARRGRASREGERGEEGKKRRGEELEEGMIQTVLHKKIYM